MIKGPYVYVDPDAGRTVSTFEGIKKSVG